MTTIGYNIREGFGIFNRAKLSGWLSIFSFFILAAVLSGVISSGNILENARRQLNSLFQLEAFLSIANEDKLAAVAEVISVRKDVIKVTQISREEAATKFTEEYGSELFDLLAENPLPPSIIVDYAPEKVTPEFLLHESEEIAGIDGVDEVTYEGDLLEKVESFAEKTRNRLVIAGIILIIVTLLFAFQAVKVAGRASKAWVRAVSLVGGTPAQVKNPFIFAGTLMGLIGGILGTVMVFVAQYIAASRFGVIPLPEYNFLIIIILICSVLGGLSAMFGAPSERPDHFS